MPFFDSLRKLFVRRPEVRLPRRWPRIVMTDTAVLTLPGERRESVKLANLCAGGARVRSSFQLPARQGVMLNVPLAAGARVNVAARVIYCYRDPAGLHYQGGLSFAGADPGGVPEVAAFVEEEQRRRLGVRSGWRG